MLALTALILGGGLFPQAYIASRHQAAEAALRGRDAANNPVRPE